MGVGKAGWKEDGGSGLWSQDKGEVLQPMKNVMLQVHVIKQLSVTVISTHLISPKPKCWLTMLLRDWNFLRHTAPVACSEATSINYFLNFDSKTFAKYCQDRWSCEWYGFIIRGQSGHAWAQVPFKLSMTTTPAWLLIKLVMYSSSIEEVTL